MFLLPFEFDTRWMVMDGHGHGHGMEDKGGMFDGEFFACMGYNFDTLFADLAECKWR